MASLLKQLVQKGAAHPHGHDARKHLTRHMGDAHDSHLKLAHIHGDEVVRRRRIKEEQQQPQPPPQPQLQQPLQPLQPSTADATSPAVDAVASSRSGAAAPVAGSVHPLAVPLIAGAVSSVHQSQRSAASTRRAGERGVHPYLLPLLLAQPAGSSSSPNLGNNVSNFTQPTDEELSKYEPLFKLLTDPEAWTALIADIDISNPGAALVEKASELARTAVEIHVADVFPSDPVDTDQGSEGRRLLAGSESAGGADGDMGSPRRRLASKPLKQDGARIDDCFKPGCECKFDREKPCDGDNAHFFDANWVKPRIEGDCKDATLGAGDPKPHWCVKERAWATALWKSSGCRPKLSASFPLFTGGGKTDVKDDWDTDAPSDNFGFGFDLAIAIGMENCRLEWTRSGKRGFIEFLVQADFTIPIFSIKLDGSKRVGHEKIPAAFSSIGPENKMLRDIFEWALTIIRSLSVTLQVTRIPLMGNRLPGVEGYGLQFGFTGELKIRTFGFSSYVTEQKYRPSFEPRTRACCVCRLC